jgi:hypothetical protein
MGPQFVLTVAFDAFVSAGVFTGTTVGTHRKVERKNFAFFSTHATGKLSTSRIRVSLPNYWPAITGHNPNTITVCGYY